MATITVTPGHTYGTTDTVTSTNLNNLGSPTAALTAGSILTADIADANVTTAKIADSNVTTAKIADSNVTTAKIADSNVTTAKIADSNVTFAKLADVIDDDTMATATDTTLATSESIKAYVDASSTSGFSPSSYTGGESVTLPNGLIMKFGSSSVGTNATNNITFGTAFTSAISAQLTILNTSTTKDYYALRIGSLSSSGLSVINTNTSTAEFYWMVIGR